MTAQPENDQLITAAREWYEAGYCVVPANDDGGKRPWAGWRDFQNERPDWAYTESLLSSGRYTAIGVICGASSGNVEMIEIEGPLDLALTRLTAVVEQSKRYAEIDLPDLLARIAIGCVEQSAGGGLHFFVRITDGPALGNTKLAMIGQGKDRKVVSETRGQGGFVIVAPSPGRNGHPEGAAYLFVNGGHPSKTVDVTAEERDLLHLLFTLALNEDDEREVEALSAPIASPVPAATYDGVSAFDDYRARVSWSDILVPAGWTLSHRMGEDTYWVRPGKKVADGHSAVTHGEDEPLVNFSTSVDWPTEQGLSKGHVYALLHHGGDLSAAAKALVSEGFGEMPESRDLPPWEAVLDPDATEEEREEAKADWVTEHLPRLDWSTVWAADHEEDWIVEPLLAAGRLVALYSPAKVGKSLLMLELAAAVATGRPMFGYKGGRPRRTLYVDMENDPVGDTRERLKSMGYTAEDLDNLVMLSFPNIAKLDTERGAKEVLAAALHYGCEIVVLDTVSRLIAGEENSNDTWLAFYRHTGIAMKRHRLALIRLDHTGKDESKGQRGGSAKSGDVDAIWKMTKRGDDIIELSLDAARFPIAETSLTLKRIDDGVLRHEVVGNVMKEKKEAAFAKLAKAGVPREKMTTRKATQMVRDAGMQCASGELSAWVLDQWAESVPTWDDIAMGDE
jgi:hypothetical protein